ncbi:FAD dependent oxidoreductase superfamily protein [Cladophialophora carrionii]|uniref:FAD dependent oxidoreductase superfamily protein n=1 Tax=Cladophialophora carrionii TaxID=86049 RepID=A0A1C1CM61_9EURO|nr:FAD dependent oxidoreductase superfamily protein [Cladophialophora carrionii]
MGGGEVPKGFPQPHPTTSYWQLPPHAIAHHRTTPALPTSTTFDYVIIGSGVSGAAVAHKLLSRNPALSILMLEARTAASGASGRNGGHCRAGWWLNFKEYATAFGEDEALKFERLEEQNVRDIAHFVREHQVDCDFQDVETADAYYTARGWAEALDVMRYREEVSRRRPDVPSPIGKRVWHGRAARERLGLPDVLGAVTYPAHTQNPYLLVCRMLELSLERGLHLQTDTPALAVRPVTDHDTALWEVHTHRGAARGKRVVLATNAYTNALHRGISETGFLTSSRSQVTAIRPKEGLSNHRARRMSVGVNDRGSGDYFMIRAPGLKGEGDILYGGGRSVSKTREMGVTDDSTVNAEIAAYLKLAAPDVFGRETWGDHSVEIRDWSGITCYTPDTFPLVGEVPGEEGLWASVGMNGHGMAMAYRSAEALVSMMTTGKEPDWFPRSFRISRAWTQSKVDLHPEQGL